MRTFSPQISCLLITSASPERCLNISIDYPCKFLLHLRPPSNQIVARGGSAAFDYWVMESPNEQWLREGLTAQDIDALKNFQRHFTGRAE